MPDYINIGIACDILRFGCYNIYSTEKMRNTMWRSSETEASSKNALSKHMNPILITEYHALEQTRTRSTRQAARTHGYRFAKKKFARCLRIEETQRAAFNRWNINRHHSPRRWMLPRTACQQVQAESQKAGTVRGDSRTVPSSSLDRVVRNNEEHYQHCN